MHKTILIVDDDEAMADNLEDILENEGYRLITANTCADALARAKENNPHVALLDLKLPDDTGINLLADLKSTNPDCVCALMTAFADVDSAITALEKGGVSLPAETGASDRAHQSAGADIRNHSDP